MSGKPLPFQPVGDQPADAEGPVFKEPWEAQVFGLVIALHERGLFSWQDWATRLGEEISLAQRQGDPDSGAGYYRHWLRALEKLASDKGLSNLAEIDARSEQWRRAYRNTPHGKPIELDAANPGKIHESVGLRRP